MKTISLEKFCELNNYLEYEGIDEEFLTKLHEATGITAESYISYYFYDEDGDYVGSSKDYLYSILCFAGIGVGH